MSLILSLLYPGDHIGNVEFVVGSPLDADDLARCDIKTASVILIRSYTLQKDATMSDEDMKELQEEIDLQGIFAVCFIEASYTCRSVFQLSVASYINAFLYRCLPFSSFFVSSWRLSDLYS